MGSTASSIRYSKSTDGLVVSAARVLITGLSGTGKSTVIAALAARGLAALDLDNDDWSHWVPCTGNPTGANPGHDWLWREERVAQLLAVQPDALQFVSGCAPNMGRFRDSFDALVLLDAPLDVMLSRIASRTQNTYGKSASEQAGVARNFQEILPRLRARATHVVDATQPVDGVLSQIMCIGIKAGMPPEEAV